MKQNITGVGKSLQLGTTVTVTGATADTLTVKSSIGSTGNILVNNVESNTLLSGSMKDNGANVIVQNNVLVGDSLKFATGTTDIVSQNNNLTDLDTFNVTVTTPALLQTANYVTFTLGYNGTASAVITKLIRLSGDVAEALNLFMRANGIPYEVTYDDVNSVIGFNKVSSDNTYIYIFKVFDNTYGAQITGNNDGSINATANLANGSVAVTQTQGDNSTKVATTEYVDTAAANAAINLENYTV